MSGIRLETSCKFTYDILFIIMMNYFFIQEKMKKKII
jgi:hypothetical protein